MTPYMERRLQLSSQNGVVQAFQFPGGEPADAAAPRRPSRSLWDIIVHRRWLIVAFTAAVVAAVALWSYTTTPIYEATTVLQIDPERPRAVAFTGIPSELAPQEDIRFNERVFEAYYNTQYERIRSRSLLARVEAALDLNHHPAFANAQPGPAGLESYINVSQVKRTRMVQITARVPDPALAAAIPNRIAKEYIRAAGQEGLEVSEFATRWLKSALASLHSRSEGSSGTPATVDPYAVAAAVGGDLLRTLKADLSHLEREVARARTVYGPQHPKMMELEADLAYAKDRLDNEVQSELTKRLKELELSAQVRVANIKVIDAAERPRTPVTPNHQRDLMLALAGGLVGGLALAFVLELGDTTLRSAREVDLITQLPSVGTVPAIRGFTRRMLAPLDDLQSLVRENQLRPERIAGEAFRSIRATVLKRGAETAPRTILVTSAQPSEGKSFIAVNLAAALAKTGHPVLLIDGDFHQPVCHHAFDLEFPKVGLSTVLARGDAPASVIVPTGVSNLSFLPTGPRPADPAALLSSERLSDLLNDLREQYRWVVIDSPPVLPASDAAVLAPVVDGVLLVMRAHATPVEAVWVARDRLELQGAKILGLVMNHVRLTRNRYFYANYG